jgi:hypothetical protein
MTEGWFHANYQTISPSSTFEPDTKREDAEGDLSKTMYFLSFQNILTLVFLKS